ncbi:MAG TPA: hypothetical protein VEN79_05360, partial [Terriglobia bacterium]|nr:hypothetical protein [Terriglobia bacterium]
MKRLLRVFIFGLLVVPSWLYAQAPASFRVLLGVTDSASTRWDGTITPKQAGHITTEGWRFEGVDNIDGTLFHLNTHPVRIFNNPTGGNVVANGFIINADAVSDSSEFAISTAQGNFNFRASEVPYGQGVYKLGGRVYVDRVSPASRLTNTPEEEDYPSIAAGPDGKIWLAYVQFHHSPNHLKLRVTPHEDPQKYSQYAVPTGGDQIWAQNYADGGWGQPIAVTNAGNDQYRTAVAVDGSGRAWVFWSENHAGNFDIFARALDASGPKDRVQISKDPGSDIDP